MNKDWTALLQGALRIFQLDIYPKLPLDIYPAPHRIFRAFKECPLENLKVVILGQDPYHDGSANGLCFDVLKGKKVPPSLNNIFKEMVNDVPVQKSTEEDSYLGHLPKQGVLLLNTALTVTPKSPGSHTELWRKFTESVVVSLNRVDNLVWILWGNHAKAFKPLITNSTHVLIEGGHPSPLNTSKSSPFIGGKYFSTCNEILKLKTKEEIKW